jgi:CMP-N-acetylneuraminic acid synthetase
MEKKQIRIVALVPMRHHSERVPGKNYRILAGKPLYTYIIETLLRCDGINQIVVDTDSPVIMDGIARDYPSVTVINRHEDLRGDDVSMNTILLHDVNQVAADFYLQTHSTNPLLKAETISRAINAFMETYPEHDSLFSVTHLQTRLYDVSGRAINHDPRILIRTQDLSPVYEENSCIYIFSRASLEAHQHRIGTRPLMFEIDRDEAWDIDEEIDFLLADFLMRRRLAEET